MALTVGQLKAALADIPDEAQVLASCKFEGHPHWVYELDRPNTYDARQKPRAVIPNEALYVDVPVLGVWRPLTPEILEQMHPGFRSYIEERIRLGEIPFLATKE